MKFKCLLWIIVFVFFVCTVYMVLNTIGLFILIRFPNVFCKCMHLYFMLEFSHIVKIFCMTGRD